MPITALPPPTVRAIGSTSTISDPCSLAKELLDNSIDASASSIAIEISQNTVDFVQVKDNGHGIPATDHALVCRRAFTSKIHTLEDLRNVGGKSLGFRGEALASAAEVSGSLTISTRVDVEPVGSSLKYGRNGELIR
jgi:DNA mismatch repair ATPase MutL